jgi:hypothetical protein
MNELIKYNILKYTFHLCLINLKRALKRANNSISSDCQGMRGPEECKNNNLI